MTLYFRGKSERKDGGTHNRSVEIKVIILSDCLSCSTQRY